MFLDNTCCSLPLQEWIKGFHVLLRKNPSSQFRCWGAVLSVLHSLQARPCTQIFWRQDIRVVELDLTLHSIMSNFSMHYILFDIYKIMATEVTE